MRNTQLVRVLRLRAEIAKLVAQPSLEALSEKYGVSVRTIRRDLQALRDAVRRIETTATS